MLCDGDKGGGEEDETAGGSLMSLIKIENLTFSYYGYVNPVFENV